MRYFLLMIVVVLVGCGTTSWVSDPSDPNNVKIEAKIRKATKKPMGELSKKDLVSIRELDLSSNELTSVKGLEKLANLERLALYQNQLTDIREIKELSQLMEVSLSNNHLTDVEGLKNLTQIKGELSLHGNKLTDVDLKNLEKLTQMTSLRLSNNQLENVKGLGRLIQLKRLYLGTNQLTNTPQGLEDLVNLEYLSLEDNKLTDVEDLKKLAKLRNLRRLILFDNPNLTGAHIAELQKALPNCRIIR